MSIFKHSQRGNKAYSLPKDEEEFQTFLPDEELLRKDELSLPEISEIDLTRHFVVLSKKNMGIDDKSFH